MKAFKYLIFLFIFFNTQIYAANPVWRTGTWPSNGSTPLEACINATANKGYTNQRIVLSTPTSGVCYAKYNGTESSITAVSLVSTGSCPSATSVDLKVPTSSGSYVCTQGCQYKLKACVDVDFESGMTCSAISTGVDCGTPKPTNPNPTPPVTQDPTITNDKTEDQSIFENIMSVIGEKLDGIKDAVNGGNQNQDGGDTGGSNGGTGDVNVNVDMSETNAKIDETNSLIDELTKWLQGEDLGDDIFGDQEPPEKELTPQQFDTSIFSGRAQCPADARLSFNLLGGKTFTKTFEFKDWCDNLEIFGSLILIASYLYGAYIIVSKS